MPPEAHPRADETPKTQAHTHTATGGMLARCTGVCTGWMAGRQLPTAAAQTRLIKECKFRKITRHCLSQSRVPVPGKGVEIFSINSIINGPRVARSQRCPAWPHSPLFVFLRRVVWEFSGFLLTAAGSLAGFSISATAAAPAPAPSPAFDQSSVLVSRRMSHLKGWPTFLISVVSVNVALAGVCCRLHPVISRLYRVYCG